MANHAYYLFLAAALAGCSGSSGISGPVQRDLAPPQSDMRQHPADLEAGIVDMSDSPVYRDPNAKPTPVGGCRSGMGYSLTEKASACPGTWTIQLGGVGYIGLCADGWAPCYSNPITAEKCASIKVGFFASHNLGWQKNPLPQDKTMLCPDSGQQEPSDSYRGLFGCGTERDAVASVSVHCGQFSVLVRCVESPQGGPAWTCQHATDGNTYSYITHPGAGSGPYKSGTLCCRYP
jgi:hypothetical protein